MIDENVSHVNNFSTNYTKRCISGHLSLKSSEHRFDLQNKKVAFSDIEVHFGEPHWSQY